MEIAVQGEAVMVRSSAAPEATITLTRAEWREFIAAAKQGLFDRLLRRPRRLRLCRQTVLATHPARPVRG
jgi:hypothetical protein